MTPDTEFSLDAGAYADCVEEVTTIAGSNGSGYVTLTGAETNGSLLMLAFKVASGPLADLATLYPRNLPIVSSGTLSAGSAGGGTLGTILAYDVTGCFVRTTGGTGGGGTGGANNQARRIVTYNMTTGAFTVGTNWETTPDNTTTYDVLLPEGMTLGSLKALNPTSAGRTLVVDAAGLADANVVKLGPTGAGTAQTARDVGAALPAAAAGATGGLNPEVVFGGTASAGSATSLTLAGASAVDSFYNHMHVRIVSGTGAGQERVIVAYVGATKVATVGRNWTTTPDNTSVYVLTGPETMASWNLFQGPASAGGATSVTLVGGSATSSIYNGALAVIVAGTGARQARVITAYNGGTGVVTVDRAWQTNPDATSVILILAADLPGADGAGNLSGSVASVAGAVGSVTGAVGSVTGSVGSVVGAVGSVTGNVGGNVVGSVASVVAAVTITAASVQAIWDALTSALTTVGSIGKLLVDNINATISSRLAGASYTAPDNTSIATILTRTDVATSTRLAPTVAGRTLDVATTGEAGLDFDNIKDATGAHMLTNITVPIVTTLTNAPGDEAGVTTLLARLTAPRATNLDNLDAAVSTRLSTAGYTAPDNATIATISANVTTALARIGAWTGTGINNILGALRAMANKAAVGTPTDLSAGGTFDNTDDSLEAIRDGVVVTPPTAVEIADAMLDRDMSLGVDSGSTVVRTPRQALRFLRNKRSISGLTMSVTREDDVTPDWSAAITTSPTAELVTSVDPL